MGGTHDTGATRQGENALFINDAVEISEATSTANPLKGPDSLFYLQPASLFRHMDAGRPPTLTAAF